jgi:Ras-like protein family protein 10B
MCEQPIQIVVIGDKGVGKTSIVRQWLFNDYPSSYITTHTATYHFTSLFNGQRLFHIRIIDTPRFDDTNNTDPQQEWVRMYCFRRAHLFLLIYDINREETFNYIKNIYREIVRIRFNTNNNNYSSSSQQQQQQQQSDNQIDLINDNNEQIIDHIPVIVVANKVDLISTDIRFINITLTNSRDIQQYVKKNFQANIILCSAKYHWHLVLLFKEVCHMLETVEDTVAKQAAQQARRRLQQNNNKHCHVM